MPLNPNNIAEKNLAYYRQNAVAYIEETLKMDMSAILNKFLNYIQDGGYILDIGCGSGRDSLFFIGCGYTVMAVDPAPEIAKLASLLLEQPVITQPAQSINETEKYDGIWACASLLHIPKVEILDTFVKITQALKAGGIWYMSFKYGTEECWDERGRFFNYYTTQSITQVLKQLTALEIVSISEDVCLLRGKSQRWLNVFVRKKVTG